MIHGTASYDISNKGLIVVVSAPSGAGKTSVLREIIKLHPELIFSVSVTTRIPRENERDGIDYYFVNDVQFDEYIKNNAFIEWAEVHGCRYGTLKKTIIQSIDEGQSVILDTDTVGAFNIKKLFPDAVLIFITTPSPDVLDERLRKRNTEPPELVKKRLDAAPGELARMKEYDYIVVNDTLDRAVSQINTILEAERLRTGRMLPKLSEWRMYLDRE